MPIILASSSPRRLELAGRVGLSVVVVPPEIDEDALPPLPPDELVSELSRRKASQVAGQVAAQDIVIAADTVVVLDGLILGKPEDEEDARRMLSLLSGRTHEVYTGLTVARGGEYVTVHEVTKVTFRTLTGGEIDAYIRTGEPFDKAGAYGIQDMGALLVEGVSGDYFNVMGLPLCRLYQTLGRFGVNLLGGPL